MSLPELPPSLAWLGETWHMIAAVLGGLIVFALCNVPGLVGETGLGLGPAAMTGAVAGAGFFLYLRRVRRTVLRAIANFNDSTRSRGFWAVFAGVFALVIALSVYGAVSAGPEAPAMSLGSWAFVGIKSIALAVFAAKFAEAKLFSRGTAEPA